MRDASFSGHRLKALVKEQEMTDVSIRHGNRLHIDRLDKSYMGLQLTPQNESGWRTIPIAQFDTLEVRFIEFVARDRRDSLGLWIELYRRDTQSSIDSCQCRDLDEAQNLGEYLISEARGLCQSNKEYGLSQ